jgi:hypothetical protein
MTEYGFNPFSDSIKLRQNLSAFKKIERYTPNGTATEIDVQNPILYLNESSIASPVFDGVIPKTQRTSLLWSIVDGDATIAANIGGMIRLYDTDTASYVWHTVTDIIIGSPEASSNPEDVLTPDYIIITFLGDGIDGSMRYDTPESTYVTTASESWENKSVGTDGWILSSEGNAIFNNIAIRGEIEATRLSINSNEAGDSTTTGIYWTGDPEDPLYIGSDVTILGTVTAEALTLNDYNYWTPTLTGADFRAGGATSGISWDGTTFEIRGDLVTGTLGASSGGINGWNISEGLFASGATTTYVALSASPSNSYSIWAGGETASTAPFSVKRDGTLRATSATITGDITATSGTFTGAVNASSGTFTGYVSAGTSRFGVAVQTGKDGIWLDANNYIYSDGTFSFGGVDGITYDGDGSIEIGTDVNITGGVTATSLEITSEDGGNILIIDNNVSGTNDGIYVNANNYWYTDGKFSVGSSTNSVVWNGTNLSVTGTINATSGYIGGSTTGWIINENYIQSRGGTQKLTLNGTAGNLYIGSGNHSNGDTPFYADGSGKFSLSNQLVFNPSLGNSGADDFADLTVIGKVRGSLENTTAIPSNKLEVLVTGVNITSSTEATVTTATSLFLNNEYVAISGLTGNAAVANGVFQITVPVTGGIPSPTTFTISITGGVVSNTTGITGATATLRELTMGLHSSKTFSVASSGGTSGQNTITISSANSNITVGQKVSGTGIGLNARVSAISSNGFTITLTVNNTGTVSGNLTFSYYDSGIGLRLDDYNWWFTNNQFRVGTQGSSFKWDGTRFLLQGSGTKTLQFNVGSTDADNFLSIVDKGNVPTYNTPTTPFYVDATGKFSLGQGLTWNGTDLTVNGGGTFTGALNGGTISIGSSNSIFKADTNGIYLGNATFGSAPFRVTPAGSLTASSASITGGYIGGSTSGWQINSDLLSNDLVGFYAPSAKTGTVTGGSTFIGYSQIPIVSSTIVPKVGMSITREGIISPGTYISAVTGTAPNYTLTLSQPATTIHGSQTFTIAEYAIYAGNATRQLAPFKIDYFGNLTATSADISGKITATSGTFTGTINAQSGRIGTSPGIETGWLIGTEYLVGGSYKNVGLLASNADGLRKNLMQNPSLEKSTAGYVASGAGTTISRVSTDAYSGSFCLQVTKSGTLGSGVSLYQNSGQRYPMAPPIQVSSSGSTGQEFVTVLTSTGISIGMQVTGTNIPSSTFVTGVSGNVVALSKPVTGVFSSQTLTFTNIYYVSMFVKVPVGGETTNLVLQTDYYNSSGSIVSGSQTAVQSVTIANGWTLLSSSAQSNAAWQSFVVSLKTVSPDLNTAGRRFLVDGVIIEPFSSKLPTYFDGNSVVQGNVPASWVGEKDLSESEMSTVAFWAGSNINTRETAPFSVGYDGRLNATDANIVGAITATSGTIGGFTIPASDPFRLTSSRTDKDTAIKKITLDSTIDSLGVLNRTNIIETTYQSRPDAFGDYSLDSAGIGFTFFNPATITSVAISGTAPNKTIVYTVTDSSYISAGDSVTISDLSGAVASLNIMDVVVSSKTLTTITVTNYNTSIANGTYGSQFGTIGSLKVPYLLADSTYFTSSGFVQGYIFTAITSDVGLEYGSAEGPNIILGKTRNGDVGLSSVSAFDGSPDIMYIQPGGGETNFGGIVTMPLQPLFSATDTRVLDITNAVLTSANCYNQIDYNVGNNFVPSTGRFTAQVSGYYEASAHFGSVTASAVNVRIRKNGVANTGPLAEIYNQAGTGSTNNYARAIIFLAVGDYIDFEAARLTTAAGVQHKRFLIRLLQ